MNKNNKIKYISIVNKKNYDCENGLKSLLEHKPK